MEGKVQCKGIFVGPPGSLDVSKDTMPSDDLDERREVAADQKFDNTPLDNLADYNESWTEDGVFWSRKIYWEGDDGSVVGSFGVEFAPDSDTIVDWWTN